MPEQTKLAKIIEATFW